MQAPPKLFNYIDGNWVAPERADLLTVENPGTAEAEATVCLSRSDDVDQAARAASRAFSEWRRVPVSERVQFLFRLKGLLEEEFEELSRTITRECGKTLSESRGELRRGIENVEVACGAPTMMQGYNSENIASGIDEILIRQPLGVVAAITPFNFPVMIPLWFLPYAIACGNCILVKPSEKVPLTVQKIFRLIERSGLPRGVAQLVNGAKEAVDAILDHPSIRAVSFVGSTPVARYVYSRAAANGKRAQCQGGAKNPIVVLPDADLEMARTILAESAFGCAGQRCLAGSVAVTVGGAGARFHPMICDAARGRRVGYGLEDGVEMGPVISRESRTRIEGIIEQSTRQEGTLLVDGRNPEIPRYGRGHFVRPTVLSGSDPKSEIFQSEIFGPVLSLLEVATLEEAIDFVNRTAYGNMACLFTSSGSAARQFRHQAEVGNVGINLGVAAPMAFFPFCGRKESFFGDLHGQGRDAIEFYTEKKVVVERWG